MAKVQEIKGLMGANQQVRRSTKFFAAVSFLVALFSGLSGHWHDGWFQFICVPGFILSCAYWLYEYLREKKKFTQWQSRLSSLTLCLFLTGGVFLGYWWESIYSRPSWQPPELPKGTTSVHIRLASVWDQPVEISELRTNDQPILLLMGTNIHQIMTAGKANRVPIYVKVKRNRLYVTAKIQSDSGGEITVDFSRPPNLPPTWDAQVCETAMEIVDGNRNPVCQVAYVRPDRVIIHGVFIHKGQVMAFGENRMESAVPPFDAARVGLKRIFRYPSGLYPCQLAR